MIFEFNKKLIKELERVRSANESTVGQVFLDNVSNSNTVRFSSF